MKSIPDYNSPREGRILTREEVKARFDQETAAVYSQDSPIYLPDFAAAFGLVAQVLPAAPRFLDIGAGTGNLSRRILAAHPGSHATLLDFSANMLAGAPYVLAQYPGCYETVCRDFLEAEFPAETFDAVVSSFALHHSRGEAEYLRMYEHIFGWLKPGGIFACCDVVDGANAAWAALNERGWRDYLREVNFTEDQIEHIFASYHVEDTPLALPRHLALLQTAGFGSTDVLWKRYNFAVYCAQKP